MIQVQESMVSITYSNSLESLYAAYFVVLHKNRKTILDILLCGKEKTYCFNDEAFDLMETFHFKSEYIYSFYMK